MGYRTTVEYTFNSLADMQAFNDHRKTLASSGTDDLLRKKTTVQIDTDTLTMTHISEFNSQEDFDTFRASNQTPIESMNSKIVELGATKQTYVGEF